MVFIVLKRDCFFAYELRLKILEEELKKDAKPIGLQLPKGSISRKDSTTPIGLQLPKGDTIFIGNINQENKIVNQNNRICYDLEYKKSLQSRLKTNMVELTGLEPVTSTLPA